MSRDYAFETGGNGAPECGVLAPMIPRWGWALFAVLCNAGCGGRAETGEQSPDSGTPSRGFYSVTWQTVTDSCQPLRPQGTFDEFVGANADRVSVVIAPTGHGHQDIRWDEPYFFAETECGLAGSFAVTSKSSHSFVVDSHIDWSDPNAACARWYLFDIPSAACSVHQIATYELEDACPTTRNRVTCS